jgi:hypothetical protein
MPLTSLLGPAKRLVRFARILRIRSIVRHNMRGGILAVDVASNNGLGARLQNCLEIFAICEEHDLQPHIRFTHRDDSSHTDYFAPFFFIRSDTEGSATVLFPRIHIVPDLGFSKDYNATLTLEQAYRIVPKYLGVKASVIDEVDAFCARHFSGRRVLGVHYRGTDKHSEAFPVSHDCAIRNIAFYIEKFPETDAIFVATDDSTFLSALAASAPSRPVITREDSCRSMNGQAVHYRTDIDRMAMYRDALVNCLLLSRCKALLKTASFLSDWSCLFNPKLDLVMLNRPHAHTIWFPARALVGKSLYEAVV